MSAKEGDDANEVYVEDEYVEDDDDDEEDDFHPGGDDDDDDDEEDDYDDEEDDNDDALYLDGTLSYDVKGQKLHYKGHGFRLESTDPVTFNLLDKMASILLLLPDHSLTTTMVGPCDVVTEAAESSSRRKPTPRKIKVTFTTVDSNHVGTAQSNLKSTGDDDDVDAPDGEEKEETKKPSLYYQVYGSEMDNPEHGIEFTGGFAPEGSSTDSHHEMRLLCQVRRSNPPTFTTATSTATSNTAAARRRNDNHENDDDDDNMDDVVDEDGIDHNELIALHEDARLSTEALRKRYRGPSLDETREDRDYVNETKKPKSHNNNDDDDDDDIEF